MAPPPSNSARVEIDCALLAKLLADGTLHACDLRCLDASSKQVLRRLCLDACQRRLASAWLPN